MDESTQPTADHPHSRDGVPGEYPPRIGVFRLQRRIGQGGMGVVYLAADENLGRPVAVKFIGNAGHDPEIRRRFKQELDTLSRLHHPAVAHIYDAGETEVEGRPVPYFVMEYIVGAETITDHMDGLHGDANRALELFETLFAGLEHAHHRGIVHRDLKPGNILVDGDGNPKIIDFGLSLPTGHRDAFESISAEGGRPAGTLGYMSPEQRTGDPHAIDYRSDIYSMGLVMARAFGRLQGVDDRTRSMIDEVIARATAPHPADRYASAAEARDAIRACRDSATVSVFVETGGDRIARKIRARDVLIPLVFGLFGAFVILPACCLALPFCGWYATAAATWYESTTQQQDYHGVRVISITTETFAAPSVAGDGPPIDPFEMRPTHGALIDRLVEAGVGVIAFDLYFLRSRPGDHVFIEGIERAVAAGVPVVLMDRTFGTPESGQGVDPDIARAASVVAPACGQFSSVSPWECYVAARPEDGFVRPSFALAAAACAKHGDLRFDLEASITDQTVRVRPFTIDEYGDRTPRGPAVPYPVTAWSIADTAQARIGLLPGDEFATMTVHIPPDDVLALRTLTYEDALAFDTESLRESVEGRVAVIGWTDPPGKDVMPHPGGRMVAAAYLQAGGIDQLQQGVSLRRAPDAVMYALCLLGGMAGTLTGRRGERGLPAAAVRTGIAGAVGAVICVGALALPSIVYPSPVVVSVIVGGIGGLMLLSQRGSTGPDADHRQPDPRTNTPTRRNS